MFESHGDPQLSYMMWLEWREGRISFIRDYRYVRYSIDDAELRLATAGVGGFEADRIVALVLRFATW